MVSFHIFGHIMCTLKRRRNISINKYNLRKWKGRHSFKTIGTWLKYCFLMRLIFFVFFSLFFAYRAIDTQNIEFFRFLVFLSFFASFVYYYHSKSFLLLSITYIYIFLCPKYFLYSFFFSTFYRLKYL